MQKEASKLTISQIQQSLGNVEKKKKVKLFRNSLAFPYNKTWPAVKPPESTELLLLLENNLSAAKINSVKVQWKDICKLSKDERRVKKAEMKSITEGGSNSRAFIVTGYSAVTRALENEEICSCIIDSEVQPFVLVKNLASLAQTKKIPVVIIPMLKSVTKKTLEYSATAVGFKNAVEKDSNCIFHPIHKCIEHLSTKFPAEQINLSRVDNVSSNPSKVSKKSQPVKSSLEIKKMYHLQVTSPKGPRVFIPPREHEGDKSSEKNLNDLSFISLSEDPQTQNIRSNKDNHAQNFDEDDEDSDDIDDSKVLFQVDTKPDELLTKSWEKASIEPSKKRKKKKQKNPYYEPTKVKIMKSNTVNAHKNKNQQN